jgi:hypothetical protein
VVCEIGTELWYRSHEGRPRARFAWTVEFPRENPTFREEPFSEKAKRLLRFSQGINACWNDSNGASFQAIYLQWDPGRIALPLAKMHSPDVCVTAAGRELAQSPESCPVSVQGITMPVRSYVFRGRGGPLHVFYCWWEDRHDDVTIGDSDSSYASRLRAVMAGRRNCGQRSVEIAVWGIPDGAEAEAILVRELAAMIRFE